MIETKKNILLFGANSFVAKDFICQYSGGYTIYPVYKNPNESLHLDFEKSGDIKQFAEKINFRIDAMLFLQGLNPSMGASQITEEHFIKMLKLNLVTPTLLVASLKEKMAANGLILFISSVSKRKGSYDPSYASAKAGLTGLMFSLAKAYPEFRFNIISLGLVEGSPVYNQMSDDFKAKHASKMRNGEFIKAGNVSSMIDTLIHNTNMNTADIAIDGGFN